MKELLAKALSGATGRLVRAGVSTAVSGAVAAHQNNEWIIAAAPLIQAIFKKLRDKYPGKFEWVPL